MAVSQHNKRAISDSPKPEVRPKRVSNEEGLERYRKGGFHPVRIGEVYDGKYEVVRKLGFGMYSTVWLVKERKLRKDPKGTLAQNGSLAARFGAISPESDQSEDDDDANAAATASHEDSVSNEPRYWAMKVLSAECYGAGKDINELQILQHLADGDSSHDGYKYITTMHESFKHVGPNGQHVCLIMKVMAEDMRSFRSWFDDRLVPTPLVQRFTRQLLQALDYAHSCGVIHTDIQPGNIMIQLPDPHLITAFLEETSTPESAKSTNKHSESYSILPSQSLKGFYFASPDFDMLSLDVALADWGLASWTDSHMTEKIQPTLLRAPEVLPEAPWGPSADIFNLGSLIPELILGHTLFDAHNSAGDYSVGKHLKEMEFLLGPLPDHVKAEGNQKIVNHVFDEQGEFHDQREMKGEKLEGKFKDLDEDERRKFVAFVKRILTLDKDFRPTASELLADDWLLHEHDDEQKK